MGYKIKDKVMLAGKNIKQLQLNRKLADKFVRPFTIKKVIGAHSQAY